MLQVDGLSVRYGAIEALQGISFQARDGEVTAVLGANGAGKTTLLRALSGLVRCSAGSATLDGTGLVGKQPEAIARLGVAHVPEGRGVIAELNVEENLRLGALVRLRRSERRGAIDEIYDLFPPLRSRRRRAASSLSGGERQMLAIGRAIVARPTLLLLDEPSLGLSPTVAAHTMELLRTLSGRDGLSVLLVEQNVRSALSVANWALVLNLGRIVVADRPQRVNEDADLRRHFLGF